MTTVVEARLAINSRAEAEAALKRGSRLSASLNGAQAARDSAVIAAAKTNSKRIEQHSAELEEIKAGLEAWSKANRKEFTGQSLVSDFGSLNFRVGNPEVTLLKGWKLKDVLGTMIRRGKVLAKWRTWIRVKFEVHKANILSEYSKAPDATLKKLQPIGLAVTKEESFEVQFGVSQRDRPTPNL